MKAVRKYMHGLACIGNLLYYSKLQTVSVVHPGQILRELLLFEKRERQPFA
jgi:hypothetical protein